MTFLNKNNIRAIYDTITDMTTKHFKDLKGKKDVKGKKEKEVKKNLPSSDSDSDEFIDYDSDEEDTDYSDEDDEPTESDDEYETVSEEEDIVEKKNKKMPKIKNKKNKEEDLAEEENESDFDKKKFRKTLLSLFPSEYSKKNTKIVLMRKTTKPKRKKKIKRKR